MSEPADRLVERLGDLVTRSPVAARVLHRRGIDFCCGSPPTLGEACAVAGLDAASVVAELDIALAEGPAPIQWDSYSLAEVVEHIQVRYHQTMERELPRLVGLAREVEERYATDEQCPHGIAEFLQEMSRDLLEHQRREEEELFPKVSSGSEGGLAESVQKMVEEHDDHSGNLLELRRMTHDLASPPEQCAAWRTLYDELALFERELMAHMHVENHILTPRLLGTDNQ